MCPIHSVALSSSLGLRASGDPPPPPWGRRTRYRPAPRKGERASRVRRPSPPPWGRRKARRFRSSSQEPLRPPQKGIGRMVICPNSSAALSSSLRHRNLRRSLSSSLGTAAPPLSQCHCTAARCASSTARCASQDRWLLRHGDRATCPDTGSTRPDAGPADAAWRLPGSLQRAP